MNWRWPWSPRRPAVDEDLRKRINDIQQRTARQLDESMAVAGSSRELEAHAASIRDRNHFVEAYLPSGPRRLKLPWAR